MTSRGRASSPSWPWATSDLPFPPNRSRNTARRLAVSFSQSARREGELRQEAPAESNRHYVIIALQLSGESLPAQVSEAIIAAPLIVFAGIGAPVGLLDQAVGQH